MACIAKRRGKYIIDFYDTEGKRRWKTLPEGTTKAKAKEVLRELEDQLQRGIYLPEKKVPLFKEVANDWFEHKRVNIRASTLNTYAGYLKNHFSGVENLKINRITTAMVEKFITEKQNKQMNIKTLRKIITTFNQVMNYSVRHKYIDYNPVRDAARPKGQGGEEQETIKVLTPKQINNFLDAVGDQKFHVLFMLAIMSGAREGELFGLKWTDIDWANKQMHIQRTFNNGAWYKPKSKTSNRKIDLAPGVLSELMKWRDACPPHELNLVFPNAEGKPIRPSNMFRQHFLPAIKKSGVPQIRFHDLRHTYASMLIAQGENIKYIQSQLGHSSPTVTLNVYAHLMSPVNQEAAQRLENSIFQTTGSKMVADQETDG